MNARAVKIEPELHIEPAGLRGISMERRFETYRTSNMALTRGTGSVELYLKLE